MRLLNLTRNLTLAREVEEARTFFSRMRGLLGRNGLPPDHALLIRQCPSIHTWFMRFAIDVIHLDGDLRVVAVARNLPPWRFGGFFTGSVQVAEMAAGSASPDRVRTGDQLALTD
ncbi:MAG: hypothetical protein GMKNLPBB_03392 [Myxococcota bacterium]|nr:hypothetical protein [Myxococcota bacterium]